MARKAKPRAPVSVSGLKTQEGVGVEEVGAGRPGWPAGAGG